MAIPRTFFITALGRSGTLFLAAILGRSSQYRVVHERRRDANLARFPIGRFRRARLPQRLRRGYGEVNSYLRWQLDPERTGDEALIERRGIIARDPRDAIASAMNRSERTLDDFELVCKVILESYDRLIALTRHPELRYDRFDFNRMTTEPDYLQSIVRWTGIEDVQVAPEDVGRRLNPNRTEWFPRWPDWERPQTEKYEQLEAQIVAPASRWPRDGEPRAQAKP